MPVLLVLSLIAAIVLLFYGLDRLMTHLSYRRAVSRRFKALRPYEPHPQYWMNDTTIGNLPLPPNFRRPRG